MVNGVWATFSRKCLDDFISGEKIIIPDFVVKIVDNIRKENENGYDV